VRVEDGQHLVGHDDALRWSRRPGCVLHRGRVVHTGADDVVLGRLIGDDIVVGAIAGVVIAIAHADQVKFGLDLQRSDRVVVIGVIEQQFRFAVVDPELCEPVSRTR